MMKPTLYIVATPIGHLEDMTHRAVTTLSGVDLVLCEDTRVTKRLLERYHIVVPTMSYHAQSSLSKVDRIIDMLREGKSLALVSDAGTPTISDPGCLLVDEVRSALGDDVSIVPVPGASAVMSVLSVSGFPSSQFVFMGFLPHKKGRMTQFQEIGASKRTVVFYESPHRFEKALVSLSSVLAPERRICVGREMTKMHEQYIVGTVSEIASHFREHPDRIRGEFAIAVEGA
jgi:16S rRNA (cytidine1402-2'-O)-methyltransferase